jgi:hypothetical protein
VSEHVPSEEFTFVPVAPGDVAEFGKRNSQNWGLVCEPPADAPAEAGTVWLWLLTEHTSAEPPLRAFTREVAACRCGCESDTEVQYVRRTAWRTTDGRVWLQESADPGPIFGAARPLRAWAGAVKANLGPATACPELLADE